MVQASYVIRRELALRSLPIGWNGRINAHDGSARLLDAPKAGGSDACACSDSRTGNHGFGFSEIMSSPRIKNSSVLKKLKSVYTFAHPVPLRGRRPSSRTLDGLRWTLGLRLDDGADSSVRQNRVVPAPVAGVKLSDKRERKRRRRSQLKNSSPGRSRHKP